MLRFLCYCVGAVAVCPAIYFNIFLSFNRNTLTDEGIEIVLTVMEAKELIGPPDAEQFDTFVRIYMVPDETVAQQTKVCHTFHFVPFHLCDAVHCAAAAAAPR